MGVLPKSTMLGDGHYVPFTVLIHSAENGTVPSNVIQQRGHKHPRVSCIACLWEMKLKLNQDRKSQVWAHCFCSCQPSCPPPPHAPGLYVVSCSLCYSPMKTDGSNGCGLDEVVTGFTCAPFSGPGLELRRGNRGFTTETWSKESFWSHDATGRASQGRHVPRPVCCCFDT